MAEYYLVLGDSLALQMKDAPTTVLFVGLITYCRSSYRTTVLADIAIVKRVFSISGKCSHIDLMIKDQVTATQIRYWLPIDVRLEAAAAQNSMKQMILPI